METVSDILAERVGNKLGQPIIVMSVPVIKNANVNGVLFATMSKNTFSQVVDIKFYDRIGYTMVMDNDGRIIFNSPDSEINGNMYDYVDTADLPSFKDTIAQNGMGIVKLVLNDNATYIGYKNINKLHNWNLVTVMPSDAALAEINRIEFSTLGLFIVLIIVLVGISLYIIYSQHKQDKLLYQYAYIDPVTGLGNRNLFLASAGKEINTPPADAETSSIMISLDVDNFKLVNSILGFNIGNVVLKILGTALQEYWGSQNIYARLSNDNFVVLLKNYKLTDHFVSQLLHFQTVFINKLANKDIKIEIILSYGIYCLTAEDKNINEVIDKASVARAKAKGHKKNKAVFYDQNLWEKFKAEYIIEKDINIALAENQFVVFLQPKFAFASKKIVGAEALIRWQHPKDGMIPPIKFIPIAEKTGLIIPLDRYVLNEVCKFLRYSLDNGLPVYPIAVNCSMVEFYQTDFINYIEQIIAAYKLPFDLIEIEITETTIISELDIAKNIVQQLRALGIKITMDDFGTGYSSLSYLRRIHFDCMKLDKSFLNEFENDSHGHNIIKAIIDLAKNLQITVVAEGVETAKQVEFLHSLECDYAQGYYFAKPMPVDDYTKLLMDNKQ